MNQNSIWLHPFALGLYLGLIFAALALYQYLRLKLDLTRYKRHLSDKLEIEADAMKRTRGDQETLRKENENLRVRIASLNDLPDRRLQRDLEIFARAEKRMQISVPGFSPAWESAKNEAAGEVDDEDSGRSIPKRVFTKLFGAPRREERALPEPESP